MQIAGHKLVGVNYVPARVIGGPIKPRLIICHDTADHTKSGDTVNWFASKECHVSAHLVVERDGSVTQMVPFNKKAAHAGHSEWNGQSVGNSVNSFSIGIEIDNPGKLDANGRAWFHKPKNKPPLKGYPLGELVKAETPEHGSGLWMPYTDAQIRTVTAICKALVEKYPEITDITTHWEVSPGRKVDTNPTFPLDSLRQAVFAKSPMPAAPAVADPVALAATEEASASSDITFDWLVEQGCRAAKLYKTARNWFWKMLGFGGATGTVGLIGQATEIDNGTVSAAGSLASEHAVLILGVLVVVLMCALAAVICLGRRYLLSALQRSGYVPKAVA